MEPSTSTKSDQAPSPTRSDKSSESEGRPVREKLKETRIDAQASSDQPPSSDQPMNDAPTNGTRGDNSTSGSDSERGRLRRKRSREDFEDENDEAKHPEKKHERHARKKSRDITSPSLSDADIPTKQASTRVPPIRENDDDENVRPSRDDPQRKTTATNRQSTPETSMSDTEAGVTSPKNKRTREQAEAGHEASVNPTIESNGAKATAKPAEERDTKRPRDATDPDSLSGATESKTKIPSGSGFANTSSTSPFAAVSPQPPTTKSTDATAKDPSQSSDSAFKSSGFGAFAKSSASPFGAGNAPASGGFAGAGGNKLSSFASKPAATGGFGALGNNPPQSSFGGTASGSKLGFGTTPSGGGFGSGFGSVAGTKLSSFASSSGSAITGLKEKTTAFGAPETAKETTEDEEEEDGDDDQDNDGADDPSEERRASQTLLQASGPLETGEENEDAIWTGRAKLYTLAGEAGKKEWQERGVGPFKLNVSRDPPLKARFVLRADGTHRLILNAAVTGGMRFGDGEGEEPKDGKLLFTAPKADGEVESHLLKLKAERGIELWRVVKDLKKTL